MADKKGAGGQLRQGLLTWASGGEGEALAPSARWTTKSGVMSQQPQPVPLNEVSVDLEPREEVEIEVELEMEGRQPRRLRLVGGTFTARAAAPAAAPPPVRPFVSAGSSSPASSRAAPPPLPRDEERSTPDWLTSRHEFHNPYSFIPAPPRRTEDPELGDAAPAGHARFEPTGFTGWITVRIEVVTPLLLPDAAKMIEAAAEDARHGVTKGHKTYPVRVDSDGQPYLPPTSLKGMLRSAYEAVTNSRMGVFVGHEEQLAYRMPAQEGLRLIPARVASNTSIELLEGSSVGAGRPPTMPAAWLQSYPCGGQAAPDWEELSTHRTRVWAYVTPWQSGRFFFWNVVALRPYQGTLPADRPAEWRRAWRDKRPTGAAGQWVEGWVCNTGSGNAPNIDRKHDERLFFCVGLPRTAVLTEPLRAAWERLIANYQEEHDEERRKDVQHPPALKAFTRWSRFVAAGQDREAERALSPGTLCYAAVDDRDQVTALYPVCISRKLYAVAPDDLLHDSLHPARTLSELSPADRVFGWVRSERGGGQPGRVAYRGQLRVGQATCEPPAGHQSAIESFVSEGNPYGLPLAILGQPKPQQGRFYVAGDQQGHAQAPGGSREQRGYRDPRTQALRGRKVYPHQNVPGGQFDHPLDDRTQTPIEGWFQEYRRAHSATDPCRPREQDGQWRYPTRAAADNEQRDDQNRSILGWVKPGTVFTVTLRVTNLSQVELGALLWLLSLPEQHCHRLGGGKPLGFGSVRITLDALDVHDGAAWADHYRTLGSPQGAGRSLTAPEDPCCAEAVATFHAAVERAHGDGRLFAEVGFIAAFVRAAQGHPDPLPTHYPRARPGGAPLEPRPADELLLPPHPDGQAYEWFVDNERSSGGYHPALCLPDLADDPGLPLLYADKPENPPRDQGGPRHGGGRPRR